MRKSSDSQRKAPSQGRSRALVEAIYEATVRILPAVGPYKVTTKKIAELAGVSIGSLYQYFPNKESVLATVMDLALTETSGRIEQRISDLAGKASTDELIDAMVELATELFLSERAKVREIYRMAPELGRLPRILRLRQLTVERLATEMERLHPGFTREEYVRVGFVGANAVMGVLHTVLYDEEQNYTNEELNEELKLMVRAYLRERIRRGGSALQ